MPRPPKKTSAELLDLARSIKSQRGAVTVSSLRQAAGGGSFHRLKNTVETIEAEPPETLGEKPAASSKTGPPPRNSALAERADRDVTIEILRLLAQIGAVLKTYGRVLDLIQQERQIRPMGNQALARLAESQGRLLDQIIRMVDMALQAVRIGLAEHLG